MPMGRWEGRCCWCRCWCRGTEKSSGEKDERDEMDGEKAISQLSSPDPAGPSSSGLFMVCGAVMDVMDVMDCDGAAAV